MYWNVLNVGMYCYWYYTSTKKQKSFNNQISVFWAWKHLSKTLDFFFLFNPVHRIYFLHFLKRLKGITHLYTGGNDYLTRSLIPFQMRQLFSVQNNWRLSTFPPTLLITAPHSTSWAAASKQMLHLISLAHNCIHYLLDTVWEDFHPLSSSHF